MEFKDGVIWDGMHPAMWFARFVADEVSRDVINRGAIITSARDGKHGDRSLHYAGLAFDLRTRDLPNATAKARYAQALREALGPGLRS